MTDFKKEFDRGTIIEETLSTGRRVFNILHDPKQIKAKQDELKAKAEGKTQEDILNERLLELKRKEEALAEREAQAALQAEKEAELEAKLKEIEEREAALKDAAEGSEPKAKTGKAK